MILRVVLHVWLTACTTKIVLVAGLTLRQVVRFGGTLPRLLTESRFAWTAETHRVARWRGPIVVGKSDNKTTCGLGPTPFAPGRRKVPDGGGEAVGDVSAAASGRCLRGVGSGVGRIVGSAVGAIGAGVTSVTAAARCL